MHILISGIIVVAAALAGLYFWLLGHWFVRILAFLVLGAIGAFLGACLSGGAAQEPAAEIFFALLGFGLAWPVASIPVYVRRHRERSAAAIWHRAMQSDLQPLIHTERVDRLLR